MLQPHVLMCWKLHLQGNMLDEIVGSIEDGSCKAAREARAAEAGPE